MEFDPTRRPEDLTRDSRDDLRRALRRRPLPVTALSGPVELPPQRLGGWETFNGVATCLTVAYGGADVAGPWVTVETARWAGNTVTGTPLRTALEHNMRIRQDRWSSVEWGGEDRVVTIDGRAVAGHRLRAGDRWWALRCSLRDLEITVVACAWDGPLGLRILGESEVQELISIVPPPPTPWFGRPRPAAPGSHRATRSPGAPTADGAPRSFDAAGSTGALPTAGSTGGGGSTGALPAAGSTGGGDSRGSTGVPGSAEEGGAVPQEPHRLLVEAVLRADRERADWMADGGPAPSLPRNWPTLWRAAVLRQADLAGQTHEEAQRAIQLITHQLTSLQQQTVWFRNDPHLRDLAISETLIFGTALSTEVPSREAQTAWIRRQGLRPGEPARIESLAAAKVLWLDAWNTWARSRPH